MEEKQRSGIMMKKKNQATQDKDTKDINHNWQNTTVLKKHLKKAGSAHRNIFSSPNTTEKLLLIVSSVAKTIRDIGKEDENDNG